MLESPRIAIVGPGAIGLFYGALLAKAGASVNLLARSDLSVLRSRGIVVQRGGATHTVTAPTVVAQASPAEIGPVDLVIVTLKTTANDRFEELIPPLLGPDTAILTLQNGLGADEHLARLFGASRVLGGLAFIACTRVAPGEVQCLHPGTITLGEFGRPAGERARAIAGWFERAGIPTTVTDRLAEARWQKLVWNVPFNGLSIACGGLSTDRIVADPVLSAEVRALMDEVAAAARALGHTVTEEFIRSQIDITPSLGAYRPSSLIDWQAGREVEIEAIWGEPLRQARAAGAPTPRLALLHALLRNLCNQRRRDSCPPTKP